MGTYKQYRSNNLNNEVPVKSVLVGKIIQIGINVAPGAVVTITFKDSTKSIERNYYVGHVGFLEIDDLNLTCHPITGQEDYTIIPIKVYKDKNKKEFFNDGSIDMLMDLDPEESQGV